jgi:hypothetical protein
MNRQESYKINSGSSVGISGYMVCHLKRLNHLKVCGSGSGSVQNNLFDFCWSGSIAAIMKYSNLFQFEKLSTAFPHKITIK